MNRIDVLLKNDKFFSLSIKEKLEIKKLVAHQPRDFKTYLRNSNDKNVLMLCLF
jgi:hypothetical protein